MFKKYKIPNVNDLVGFNSERQREFIRKERNRTQYIRDREKSDPEYARYIELVHELRRKYNDFSYMPVRGFDYSWDDFLFLLDEDDPAKEFDW